MPRLNRPERARSPALPQPWAFGKLARLSPDARRVPVSRLLLPTLLAFSVTASLAQAQTPAHDPWMLCPPEDAIPAFVPRPAEGWPDRATSPSTILAESFDYSAEDTSVLDGNVELQRGDQWLGSDRVTWEHATERYRAQGNVRYQDEALRFVAREARGDQPADRIEVDAVRYQLVQERGNGEAEHAVLVGRTSTLSEATYSTCDPQQRAWTLRARRVDVDHDEGLARIRGARLHLGNTPVAYLPYLVVPVDDRRRTGFLYPTFGRSGRRGTEIEVPFYINLAPNYDATLTPRWMSRRGVMLSTEGRYLGQRSNGILEFDYLPDDREADRDRHQIRLRHGLRLNQAWSTQVGIHRISDTRYLEDFGESLGDIAISQIRSIASLNGRGQFWSTSLSVSDWQLADPLLSENALEFNHRPRLQHRWDRPWLDWLQTGLRAEAVDFSHPTLDGGRRLDLKPYLRLPFEGAWWFLRPELAWRYTAYELDRENGERRPERSLPIASVDGGLFFERTLGLGRRSFIQTLEPRLYYLRVPYRDQSDLPLFDTRELTFGYAQLFRDNIYSGADRQADANQATVALTTRLLDESTGREWLSGSLGQIRYFDPPRVGLRRDLPERSKSAYVADVDLRTPGRWSLGLSQQWDPETRQTLLRSYRAQYRLREDGVVNLAYRYRPDEVEQADLSFAYPVTPAWRAYGRWNYSFLDRSTFEAFGGVEWQSCCMAVRVLGRHYLRNREGEKDNALYVEIELKGLGSFGRETERLLQDGILDYVR